MQFHGGVDLAFRPVGLFQNDIRFTETLLDISPFVLLRLCKISSLADLRGPGVEGLRLIHDKRKGLKLNLDGPQRIPCLVRRLSGNSGDGFPFEPAMRIEESFLDVAGIGPLHIGQAIGIVDDGADSGHLFGCAQINALDDRIRVGGSENGSVKGIGQVDIRRIDSSAAQPLVSIQARHRCPDDLGLLPGFGRFSGFRGLR